MKAGVVFCIVLNSFGLGLSIAGDSTISAALNGVLLGANLILLRGLK